MPRLRRLNQTIDLYNISDTARGKKLWALQDTNIKCRANEGTAIVSDTRGEDIQYDLILHTDYHTQLVKGQGVKYNLNYYLIDDVRITRDLNGDLFMQFVMLKKTDNEDF